MNEQNTQRLKQLLKVSDYQPIEHPDFAAGKAQQPCVDRFDMIMEALQPMFIENGTVIDFGCHSGWFCRAFSRIGWQAIGADRSPEWIEAARLLNEYAGIDKPLYVQADVLKDFDFPLPRFDVALVLSIAMYLFEDEARGWKFFDDVSRAAPVMFLDAGGPYAERLPFKVEDIGDLIVQHTQYRSWRSLGESALGRSLLMFRRG